MSDSGGESEGDIPLVIDGKLYPYITKNSLDYISLTSYGLGILLGISVALIPQLTFNNISGYIISLSVFHFLEFFTTAKFNPGKVSSESFLINNGRGYVSAHAFAVLEAVVEYIIFPTWKSTWFSYTNTIIVIFGLILIIMGQIIRSLSMITAGQSFSHTVKTKMISDHKLITTGIYSFMRHPSYFGFFWWAIGTQLLLLNPISLVTFILVLWNFFNKRIIFEERFLVKFFGVDYLKYKVKVGVGIPFID